MSDTPKRIEDQPQVGSDALVRHLLSGGEIRRAAENGNYHTHLQLEGGKFRLYGWASAMLDADSCVVSALLNPQEWERVPPIPESELSANFINEAAGLVIHHANGQVAYIDTRDATDLCDALAKIIWQRDESLPNTKIRHDADSAAPQPKEHSNEL